MKDKTKCIIYKCIICIGGSSMNSIVKNGISFGTALALVISYANWHSIPWSIFHGILGWVYVIYYAIVH